MTKKQAALTAKGYADGATLEQVAQELGVTRERVRQIERAALEKLRRIARARGVRVDDVLDAQQRGAD